MSSTSAFPPSAGPPTPGGPGSAGSPAARLERLFEELAELQGQRNAIDGRIVEIISEVHRDGLWGNTGARSVEALVAWKTGTSPGNAKTIATVARRLGDFPRCAGELKEGRLSIDQVGAIAERGADGSDEHFAALARHATVTQLRTALRLQPRPDAGPPPERTITRAASDDHTTWRITLPRLEAARFDAALQSHLDALIADWTAEFPEAGDDARHGDGDPDGLARPFPTMAEAFLRLVDTSWDAEATRRPHHRHTTVIAHFDVTDRVAELHLGPMLSEAERRQLLCDATFEVWFHRDGQPIGSARNTRQISSRLRRALERRDQTCAIPGCSATRGLHAHHIVHWEDGGHTELTNLVLLCPHHHRLHHRGIIAVAGPADSLRVTDGSGRVLTPASIAHRPTRPPPDVGPWAGPTGGRAQWRWYQPFEPAPPSRSPTDDDADSPTAPDGPGEFDGELRPSA